MYVATGHAHSENREAVVVRDKRQESFTHSQQEGEWLAISELGSKALYQVYAARFIPIAPYKQ
jgi:hypothetical protein